MWPPSVQAPCHFGTTNDHTVWSWCQVILTAVRIVCDVDLDEEWKIADSNWYSLKCAAFVCFTPSLAFSFLSIPRIGMFEENWNAVRCVPCHMPNKSGQTRYPFASGWDGVNFLHRSLYGTVLSFCGYNRVDGTPVFLAVAAQCLQR